MMDEVWSRGWMEAHKAALQAHEALVRDGQPMPSLWNDLRRLVRDLISPPALPQAQAPCGDAGTCQSAA
ncbi:hypothetical protein [Novosphingobium fuchskuhlense]|nr:hypothetical protein [Novosphingobium fuchskuhlense]